MLVDCPVHGTLHHDGSGVCSKCLSEHRSLYDAYARAHRALMRRVDEDRARTPFRRRKEWPEWRQASEAHDAFFGLVPRLKPRVVVHERKPVHKRESCGGACLSGKRACSCTCGGFCHGAGECRCGTPEHKEFLRVSA